MHIPSAYLSVDAQPLLRDLEWPSGRTAFDYYFIQPAGGLFKTILVYEPHSLLACAAGTEIAVERWFRKTYEGALLSVTCMRKEDLAQPDHLLSTGCAFLQLQFRSVSDLLAARKELLPLAARILFGGVRAPASDHSASRARDARTPGRARVRLRDDEAAAQVLGCSG
jgi:hypothetical protein